MQLSEEQISLREAVRDLCRRELGTRAAVEALLDPAHIADRILLLARTSREEKRHAGLTVFEVPAQQDGIVTRYATEYGMEANLRDAVLLPIYAGANEIQREIISGSLGLV
jgi:alkylation response protein AidB-like acyl-CoA dehydrogenase